MIRVAHISYHGCIRLHKMAYEFCRTGHDVHLIASQISSTHSWNTYSTVNLFNADAGGFGLDIRQLQNAVRVLKPHVDLYHVHNEPNWIFKATKTATMKPVIFDIHDWTSLRKAAPTHPLEIEEEKFALQYADGFCVPSKGYLRRIQEITKKPTIMVYSKLGSWLYPEVPKVKLPGFTYAGGVSNGGNDTYNYPYRNWAEVGQKLAEKRKVYFYSANPGDFSKYKHENIQVFPPKTYPDLLNAIAQHSVGMVGSPYPLLDFEDSMPNKLFEYISAGIPVVAFNSPEVGKFVEENKLGYSVKNASEALDVFDELSNDTSVVKKRWELAMEAEVPRLTGFYKEVLESCKDLATPPGQADPTDQAGKAEK